jgi:hypothetical protein
MRRPFDHPQPRKPTTTNIPPLGWRPLTNAAQFGHALRAPGVLIVIEHEIDDVCDNGPKYHAAGCSFVTADRFTRKVLNSLPGAPGAATSALPASAPPRPVVHGGARTRPTRVTTRRPAAGARAMAGARRPPRV